MRLAYFGRQGGVLQQELRETKQTYRLHALAPRDVEAVNERRQAVEHGPQQFRMLDYIIGSCQTIQVRFFVNEVLQGVHESLVHYNGQLLKQTRPENWNCQIRRQIQKHHTCPHTHTRTYFSRFHFMDFIVEMPTVSGATTCHNIYHNTNVPVPTNFIHESFF